MKLSETINNALQCVHSGDRVEAGDLEWWIQMAQKLEKTENKFKQLTSVLSRMPFDYREFYDHDEDDEE